MFPALEAADVDDWIRLAATRIYYALIDVEPTARDWCGTARTERISAKPRNGFEPGYYRHGRRPWPADPANCR